MNVKEITPAQLNVEQFIATQENAGHLLYF